MIEAPFNEDFCSVLEYHLTRTFANSADEELKWIWCDGILMPADETQLIKKLVNDTRKIETRAWIGTRGEKIFDMTIKLGKYALRRYAKGSTLEDCLPDEALSDWIIIDLEEKKIELQLK